MDLKDGAVDSHPFWFNIIYKTFPLDIIYLLLKL